MVFIHVCGCECFTDGTLTAEDDACSPQYPLLMRYPLHSVMRSQLRYWCWISEWILQ